MNRLLLALVLLSHAGRASALVDIGVAAAVRGAVKASAPGAAGRVVETGKPVYSHDKITTGPEGKLQILLLDQTSFTIGPNSELELDEFVYDPATNAGKVSAKIAKGAFRFITGKVARRDPASMQVTMPVGTIGIRGTMTAGNVSDKEATIVLLGPGPGNNADEKQGGITVSNGQGSVDVDMDGYGVTIKGGQAPSAPFKLDAAQLDGILGGVDSAPKGDSKDQSSGEAAGESSGQDTAVGKATASDAFAVLESAQGETSQFASQQFSSNSRATWEQVIAVTGGTGKYTGSGSFFDCTGGTCGTTPMGTTSFNLAVDFGAKTLGGSGSSIILTSPANTSGNINSFSYASFTGDAKINLQPFISGSNWTGTTLELVNAGGVTAGAATIDVRWDTGFGTKYGGPVTAPLQP